MFDLERVDAFLARQVWTRTVSQTGTVSVTAHRYTLGRPFAGQTVSLTFLLDSRSFRFETAAGLHPYSPGSAVTSQHLMAGIEKKLSQINHGPNELKELSKEQCEWIWLQRQKIVRVLAGKVVIHSNGKIEIEGMLDGSEVSSIELESRGCTQPPGTV